MNFVASAMRGAYPGPGTTIGPALVFGWRAAMHARGLAPRDSAPSAGKGFERIIGAIDRVRAAPSTTI
jgi:hypothetical protein